MKNKKGRNENGTRHEKKIEKEIALETQYVFTFYTKEKFFEALEFARQVVLEDRGLMPKRLLN